MNAAVECTDLEEISSFLGFAPQHIFYLVESPETYYTSIEIPKNSDPTKFRTIDIPFSELKGVQRVIHKKILSEYFIHDCVHSYVGGRSILTATQQLCGGRAILKMDIKDFFPSITEKRVIGLFKSFGFNDSVAYILSRLCIKGDCLAQGAPTSPTISNLIMRKFDKQLALLSSSWELGYLRYSDDVFLHKEKNFNHPKLANYVIQIIEQNGFEVNLGKTKYYPRLLPRITLGLLTHGDTPRIPGTSRKKYRAAFFRASRDIQWADENQTRLRGMLEWYKCVHGKDETYNHYSAVYKNIGLLKIHDSYRSK
ncbi:reverse transcriptase domain-containing protein [Sneathiella sp.]|uniref:reverse transcriptase domain-containing protein n=1 Tax=Sneathiella sp. TaxID=1964365 RepID=UPI003568519F